MNERSRGRNVRLMLIAINLEGKPAIAEVILPDRFRILAFRAVKKMQ
ncbi:hypothetical protein [Arsenophonus nasoniae]|nr:hypothetical protein [Arsenophonus nasoniae]